MNKYYLETKAPSELLKEVIKVNLPCTVSIEGWLQDRFESIIKPTLKEATDILKRNTSRPKLDLWVFDLDASNYDEFQKAINNASGLFRHATGIIHVQVQKENIIVFGAYDNFDSECTVLYSGEEFVNNLQEASLIYNFRMINT